MKQYRPISLLCNTSKVFKKVMFNELYDIVKTTLHNTQHGFRRNRSVVTQMLLFLNNLYNKFDGIEEELLVLYLEFKKPSIGIHMTSCYRKLKCQALAITSGKLLPAT